LRHLGYERRRLSAGQPVSPAKTISQPKLPFFAFNIYSVLRRVQKRFPSLAEKCVPVWIMNQPILACIENGQSVSISLHPILNHPQTPELVIEYIFTHELLHLVVSPRKINGILKQHPPEFYDAEKRIFPESGRAWGWLILVFGDCLKRDSKKECVFVKRWWRRLMKLDRSSIDQVVDTPGINHNFSIVHCESKRPVPSLKFPSPRNR